MRDADIMDDAPPLLGFYPADTWHRCVDRSRSISRTVAFFVCVQGCPVCAAHCLKSCPKLECTGMCPKIADAAGLLIFTMFHKSFESSHIQNNSFLFFAALLRFFMTM